jgi:hypothetical protein
MYAHSNFVELMFHRLNTFVFITNTESFSDSYQSTNAA